MFKGRKIIAAVSAMVMALTSIAAMSVSAAGYTTGTATVPTVVADITTGASQDIKQATGLAKSMVTKFGMSEAVGLINYDDDNNEVFIGRDLAHTARGYGEGVATVIDQEVKRIIDECYDRARHIIRKYDDVLHACADLLLEKEKISREEFEALFPEDVSED